MFTAFIQPLQKSDLAIYCAYVIELCLNTLYASYVFNFYFLTQKRRCEELKINVLLCPRGREVRDRRGKPRVLKRKLRMRSVSYMEQLGSWGDGYLPYGFELSKNSM